MRLRWTRRGARGVSGMTSVTATRAAVLSAHADMLSAGWTPLAGPGGGLPPHKYMQSGSRAEYDAYMYCGDYRADETRCEQKAYCGAVAYTAELPAGALSGAPCSLAAVGLRAHGDRWLAQGAILDAYLTASPEPPPLADIEAGTADGLVATTGEPADAGAQGAAYPPPFQRVRRSNTGEDPSASVNLAVGAALGPETRYLHLVLRLGDYGHTTLTDTGAVSAWIEGSAALAMESIDVAFSRDPGAGLVAPLQPLFADPLAHVHADASTAYSYRPFAYDSDVEAMDWRVDREARWRYPLECVVRDAATAEAVETLRGRAPAAFTLPLFGHFRNVDFGFSGLAAEADEWCGVRSLVVMATFRTEGLRIGGLRLRIRRELFVGPEALRALAPEIRIDAWALPWPILVFRNDGSGQMQTPPHVLSLSTMCDADFLDGTARYLSFVSAPTFASGALGVGRGVRALPLYAWARDEEGEGPALLTMNAFGAAPLSPGAVAQPDAEGLDSPDGAVETIPFAQPLDAPEKCTVLCHLRMRARRARPTAAAVREMYGASIDGLVTA